MEQIVRSEVTGPMYQSGFDYSQLDQETAFVAQQIAARIRQRNVSMAEQYIDNGKDLLLIKAKIPVGFWQDWLRDEFNWQRSTALRMMRLARVFGDMQIGGVQVSIKALDLLAQQDVPESIRSNAISLIESGEVVTATDAIDLVGQHSPDLAEHFRETERNYREKSTRRSVNSLVLQIAELGFAVRNMQMALASSYPIPYNPSVADALERLQIVADTLIQLAPQPDDPGKRHHGLKMPGASSRYRGVLWYARKHKWKAALHAGGKSTHLGYYDDEEQAARAYDAKARELYGDTARLNFPGNA